MLQLLSLTKWFIIQIWVIHDNISSQVTNKRRQGFEQWMNSSITNDNICWLIHKKCHPKSYHSDIKYHMTLNIMFSVVGTCEPYPTGFPLHLGGFVLINTRIWQARGLHENSSFYELAKHKLLHRKMELKFYLVKDYKLLMVDSFI
jgi:hypothetical protein